MNALADPPQELLFLAPEILLLAAGLLLLLLGTRGRLAGPGAALVAAASLLLAGLLVLRVQAALEERSPATLLGGLVVLDSLVLHLKLLLLATVFFAFLLASPRLAKNARTGRYCALLLLATAGLLLLASGVRL